MAKLQVAQAGLNSGAQALSKKMRASDIRTTEELSSIFEIEDGVLRSITESMMQNGFDPAEPIVVWKETGYVVDGHTRLKAAHLAGIIEIPVTEKHFKDISAAQEYTRARQINRRNLTQAEILRIAGSIRLKEGRDGSGRSIEQTAASLGVSASSLQHARTVWKRADEGTKRSILNNEMSINQGYQRVVRRKKPPADGADATVKEGSAGQGSFEGDEVPIKEVINAFIQKALAEIDRFCSFPEGQAALQDWLKSHIQQ